MLERRILEIANGQKNQGAEARKTKLVVPNAIRAWKRLEGYSSLLLSYLCHYSVVQQLSLTF